MSLFLALGFPLFGFFMSLSLFAWKKPLNYLMYWILGLISFLIAWAITYFSKAIYGGLLDYSFFSPNSLGDLFFSTTLLVYLPVLLFSFISFFGIIKKRTESYFSSLYFWFAGFFTSFSIYILLQSSTRYSFFEYLLLPLLFMSFFVCICYSLLVLHNLSFWINMGSLILIGIFFSLPSILWESLYTKSFYFLYFLCLISGFFASYFLSKHKKV